MKRINMNRKEAENRQILDGMLSQVDTSAADDAASEKAYAEKLAAIDEQAAMEQADIERRKAAVDAASDAHKLMLANKPTIELDPTDAHKAKAAPLFDALASFGNGLDLSTVRAKYLQYGEQIADALTEFVGANAVESVALPICRLRALARIVNDESTVKHIGEIATPDGKGTYGKTKAPVTRFIMDVLELSKQQTNTYIRVIRECVDKATNELKPEFRGFSFTQLDVLSQSKAPSENAASVDADLSMKDFRESVSKLDTIRATATANESKPAETSGQPDEQKPESKPAATSGQPDEQKPESKPADNLVSFVVGNVPEGNQFNFKPITNSDGKTLVIRAVNLTSAVALFTDTSKDPDRVMFRLPKAAEKSLIEKLAGSFAGYIVKAIVGDVKGYMGRASLYALCTVETVGTDETAETTKQAAKRIETARTVLANWLTGAAALEGIPAAMDVENAMEIFKRAYELVQATPRMSAQSALAELVKSGDFKTVNG